MPKKATALKILIQNGHAQKCEGGFTSSSRLIDWLFHTLNISKKIFGKKSSALRRTSPAKFAF
jgi:hypothetical protein